MKRNSRYFKVFLSKTTSKLPFLKDFGHCPKILDYTLTSLYSKCDQTSDPWQQLELASELEIWSTRHCGLVQKNGLFISMLGKLNWLRDRSNNNGSIDVKIDGSALEEKSSFKMLGLTFSSKLDYRSFIISIAKTVFKKIGALTRSMKLLSPEVDLHLYKSAIHPCMEYSCHAWAGAPSCYLEL